MVNWTQVDESNTSAFAFENSRNGNWFRITDNHDFGGTSMQTRAAGSAVRVTFRGKAIQLFGAIDQVINATASIDGAQPDTVFQDIGTKSNRQRLYASPQLQYGDHTLLVTQLSDQFPLIVDYVQVDEDGSTKHAAFIASPTSTTSTDSFQSLPSSVSQSTSSTDVNPASSSTISSTSTSSQSAPSTSNSPSGGSSLNFDGVAGIVISTALVLGSAVLVVIWLKRRIKRAKLAKRPRPYSPASAVSPYPLPMFATTSQTTSGGSIPEKPQLRPSDASHEYLYSTPPVRERNSFLQGSSTMNVELSSVYSTSSEDLHSREPPSRAFKALMSASPSKTVFEPRSSRPPPPPSPNDTDSTWSMSTTPRSGSPVPEQDVTLSHAIAAYDLAAAIGGTFESDPGPPVRRMGSVPRRGRAMTLGSELPTYSESIRWSRSAQFGPSGPRRMGTLRDYPPPPESPP